MHDGTDARAARIELAPSGASLSSAAGLGDIVSAFQEVASGVEGAHRALLERVERLHRDLDRLRAPGVPDGGPFICDGETTLETIERRSVIATLHQFGGHRDRTARALGIGVRTLGMKLRQWKDAGLVPEHL